MKLYRFIHFIILFFTHFSIILLITFVRAIEVCSYYYCFIAIFIKVYYGSCLYLYLEKCRLRSNGIDSNAITIFEKGMSN